MTGKGRSVQSDRIDLLLRFRTLCVYQMSTERSNDVTDFVRMQDGLD